MLDYKTPPPDRSVDVVSEAIRVRLSDIPGSCSLVLPSPEEIRDIRVSFAPRVSVQKLEDHDDPLNLALVYEEELARLNHRASRFQESPTFLTRVANMSQLTGNLAEALRNMELATRLDEQPYLIHELGSIMIDRDDVEQAQALYESCDLNNDWFANLRLAHISIIRNNVSSAEKHVHRALAIDESNYRSRMFEGALNLWKQDWERAVRSFRIAAETFSGSSSLFVNLAAAHWSLGHEDKAEQSLKRAINLDPLNRNAILFYADVMLIRGMPDQCIGPLDRYLKYEQNYPAAWARLAKSYWLIGSRDNDNGLLRKSLESLKKQATIEDTSGVWNNIGVVNVRLKKITPANRFFAQSVARAQALDEDAALPLSNLLSMLIERRKFPEALKVSSDFLDSNIGHRGRWTKSFSRVQIQRIVCMEAVGRRDDASREIEELLAESEFDDESQAELLIHLINHRTVINPDLQLVKKLLPDAEQILNESPELSKGSRSRMVNNMVFALLSVDEVDRARKYLSELSELVGYDPFSTATYGLFLLKTGRLEKAEASYKEAVSLAVEQKTKNKIRQKMHLELGKAYLRKDDLKRSTRHLKNVGNQEGGFESATRQAEQMLRRLSGN